MYSADPGSQGLYALEMLLHEVQHVDGISSPALDTNAKNTGSRRYAVRRPELTGLPLSPVL
jgi:hypothetical protein